MNFCGSYVGHWTGFRRMITSACCLVVALDLVSGWLVVMHTIFILLSVVIVTLPFHAHRSDRAGARI